MKVLTPKIVLGIAMACLQIGCTNSKVIPNGAMPSVPSPELYKSATSITNQLDCLSGQLSSVKQMKSIKIAHVTNGFSTQIGELTLPVDFSGFVQESLGRISNGFVVYTGKDILPQLSIEGQLIMAREARTTTIDSEIVGLGIGSEVKAYDFTLRLQLVDTQTRKLLSHSTITSRIFSGQEGSSVFKLHGGDYSRGSYRAIEHFPVTYGLQMLSDAGTYQILRKFAAKYFNIPIRNCSDHQGNYGLERWVDRSNISVPLNLNIKRSGKSGEHCLSIPDLESEFQHLKNTPLKVTISQYRDTDILVGQRFSDIIVNISELQALCFDERIKHPQAQELEVSIEHVENGTLYGSARTQWVN